MAARLDHTIVWCSDKQRSSAFMAEMLGLPDPVPFARFMVVRLANGVSMDFAEKPAPISGQHYAFLVSEAEFDAGMGRIADKGLTYWADPARTEVNRIRRRDGGRGVYFEDPDGHVLELISRPPEAESEP